MSNKYTSNATWSKAHDTRDFHDSKEAAEAVCKLLRSEYSADSPCPIRGICLGAWTNPDGQEIKTDGQKLVAFLDRMMGRGQ